MRASLFAFLVLTVPGLAQQEIGFGRGREAADEDLMVSLAQAQDQRRALQVLEARGMDVDGAVITGDLVVVEGDIGFYISDLVRDGLHEKGRRWKASTIDRGYQDNIVLIVNPVLEPFWGEAVREAVSVWNNAHIYVRNVGRYQRTRIRIRIGSWSRGDWYYNKIQVIPGYDVDDPNSHGSTSLGDFPAGGRPGRYLRLTRTAGNGNDGKPWQIVAHELGHTLGFYHFDDCNERRSVQIGGTNDLCKRPRPSIMNRGGQVDGFNSEDHLSAVKLYPGRYTTNPPGR